MSKFNMSKFGIGIFQGKKARYNKLIIQVLYNNGPLTLWEIAKQIRKLAGKNVQVQKDVEYGRTQIIQSVVARRLKELEKKKYVTKLKNRKWSFLFKGVLAYLIMEPNPKPLGEAWYEFTPQVIPKLQKVPSKLKYKSETMKLDISTEPLREFQKNYESRTNPENFKSWIQFANATKDLMAQGVVNLDLIANELLVQLLIYREREKEGFAFPIGLLDGKVEAIFK